MQPRLRDADLGKELSKKAYKQRTKENQVRLAVKGGWPMAKLARHLGVS